MIDLGLEIKIVFKEAYMQVSVPQTLGGSSILSNMEIYLHYASEAIEIGRTSMYFFKLKKKNAMLKWLDMIGKCIHLYYFNFLFTHNL